MLNKFCYDFYFSGESIDQQNRRTEFFAMVDETKNIHFKTTPIDGTIDIESYKVFKEKVESFINCLPE